MTTLYSATGLGSTLTVECDGDIVHLTAFSSAETSRAWANPKRAELLAALGAVDKGEAEKWERIAVNHMGALSRMTERAERAEAERDEATSERIEADENANHWKACAEAAEAKLAEAEATIERVRALGGRMIGPTAKDLWASLNPPKPFVLPTTVPARIEVRHRETNTRDELVLWTDGTRQTWWDAEDSSEYTPEQVMDQFTDHRLIGADDE